MKFKNEFPKTVDYKLYSSGITGGLKQKMESFVREFTESVFPVLKRFSIFDEGHVLKYLTCTSFESIYDDILQIPGAKFLIRAQEDVIEDYWKPFMGNGSTSDKPSEEGFVFRSMPFSRYTFSPDLTKLISFRDEQLKIDYEGLFEVCVVHPTDTHRTVYDLLVQFCQDLENLGYGGRPANELFIVKDGKNVPNVPAIFWNYQDVFRFSRYRVVDND